MEKTMYELAIKNKLEKIFRVVFDDEEICINDEMTADDIEEWDSLAHINLVVAIEREYKIRFALGELMVLQDVGGMINLIVEKLK